jgi:hypothetical protein
VTKLTFHNREAGASSSTSPAAGGVDYRLGAWLRTIYETIAREEELDSYNRVHDANVKIVISSSSSIISHHCRGFTLMVNVPSRIPIFVLHDMRQFNRSRNNCFSIVVGAVNKSAP